SATSARRRTSRPRTDNTGAIPSRQMCCQASTASALQCLEPGPQSPDRIDVLAAGAVPPATVAPRGAAAFPGLPVRPDGVAVRPLRVVGAGDLVARPAGGAAFGGQGVGPHLALVVDDLDGRPAIDGGNGDGGVHGATPFRACFLTTASKAFPSSTAWVMASPDQVVMSGPYP